jgi:hypothetical protein
MGAREVPSTCDPQLRMSFHAGLSIEIFDRQVDAIRRLHLVEASSDSEEFQ